MSHSPVTASKNDILAIVSQVPQGISMKAVITGSGGLIGSECVRLLSENGWQVAGVDNDMRRQFFGEQGTTRPVVDELRASIPSYRHIDLDIRDRQGVR